MTPLPPSVKIGYSRYTIVDWAPRASISADRYGECDITCREIRVSTVQGWSKAANTLLHEILHAVWYHQALHDSDDQERCVTSFANGLSMVWVDNPDVIAWINAGLTSGDY